MQINVELVTARSGSIGNNRVPDKFRWLLDANRAMAKCPGVPTHAFRGSDTNPLDSPGIAVGKLKTNGLSLPRRVEA